MPLHNFFNGWWLENGDPDEALKTVKRHFSQELNTSLADLQPAFAHLEQALTRVTDASEALALSFASWPNMDDDAD